MSSGIYGHPALYAAFHQLEPELVRAALGWANSAIRAPRGGGSRRRPPGTGIRHVQRVFEPACGPGQWLSVFARMGCVVAGLDMQAAMVAEAKRTVHKAIVHQGDMSAPPSSSCLLRPLPCTR